MGEGGRDCALHTAARETLFGATAPHRRHSPTAATAHRVERGQRKNIEAQAQLEALLKRFMHESIQQRPEKP